MNIRHLLTMLLCSLSAISFAEQRSLAMIGNDAHAAGETILIDELGIDNIFAVGESVNILSGADGSLHLLGEQITVSEFVGNSIYAAGQTISILGDVSSNVIVAGESVQIFGEVGNDLKVAAQSVILDNNIGGDVTIAAESVEINGVIGGSVLLVAEEFNFSPQARIDGTLTIYAENQENIILPSGIISPDRIFFKPAEDFEDLVDMSDDRDEKPASYFGRFVFLTLLFFAISFFMKTKVANGYARGWSGFWPTVGYGVLTYSALVGSIIVLALTIIGIPFSVLLIIASLVLWVVSYLMGSYFIVSKLWQKYRKDVPESKLHLAIVAGLSAASVMIIANIPGLGWWLVILVTMFGVGAIAPWRIQPKTTES